MLFFLLVFFFTLLDANSFLLFYSRKNVHNSLFTADLIL